MNRGGNWAGNAVVTSIYVFRLSLFSSVHSVPQEALQRNLVLLWLVRELCIHGAGQK